MKAFALLLLAVIAALVLLMLILIGAMCGAVSDAVEWAIAQIDRLGKWLAQPIRGEAKP